jgi:hypothetical protein
MARTKAAEAIGDVLCTDGVERDEGAGSDMLVSKVFNTLDT